MDTRSIVIEREESIVIVDAVKELKVFLDQETTKASVPSHVQAQITDIVRASEGLSGPNTVEEEEDEKEDN